MFKNILVGLILFLGFYANAQTIDPIEIDRPDQTECPAIVPVGMFQMENGFNFEKVDVDSTTLLLPSSLLKVGIYNNFELRLITEFTIQETLTEKIIGLKPIYLGFKIKICEEKGWLPIVIRNYYKYQLSKDCLVIIMLLNLHQLFQN